MKNKQKKRTVRKGTVRKGTVQKETFQKGTIYNQTLPPHLNQKKFIPKGNGIFSSFLENIYSLNSSKFFTGLIMLTVNIGSKYVTLGLSKTQEDYIRYTVGRQILVFAILWMGTRDIIVALILMCVFILFADYLLNDNSKFCVIPHQYSEKIKKIDSNENISNKDINDAINLLKKARTQKNTNKSFESDYFIKKGLYKENFI